nr:MAG TPA: hypothetical protein [Caudoviricetes sp.]DAX18211.1 MAG TPA: hypothetical protein [Caudoviricetes sp.]
MKKVAKKFGSFKKSSYICSVKMRKTNLGKKLD